MTSGPRGYHHGNLRPALLAATVEELLVSGPVQLSLRRVARRAGVSHAAPSHHFGDKRGLFTAVATEGFRLLYEQTNQALDAEGALLGSARRYVQFALGHPAHFAVMFDPSLFDPVDPVLDKERTAAFEVLYEAIRRATDVTDDDELEAQTLAAWFAVHGIATLWLSGNLPYERDPRLVPAVLAELAPALARVAEVTAEQAGWVASAADPP